MSPSTQAPAPQALGANTQALAESAFSLPLPLDPLLAQVLLGVGFVLHIVFVNLTLGGSIMACVSFSRARRDAGWVAFHRELLSALTYMKSLAVVLGVAPLLLISVLHADRFYASSVLVAPYWLGVLPLLLVAFVALYGHTYAWDRLWGRHPRALGALLHLATACFLLVPWVYLTNLALMQNPELLAQQAGFWQTLAHSPNVPARFAHFLLASVAIQGLWVAAWWGRRPGQGALRAWGLRWALGASLGQYLAGLAVWWSLPSHAWHGPVLWALGVGVALATAAMLAMAWALRGRPLWPAVMLLGATVVVMACVRHLHREAVLADRQASPVLDRPLAGR